MLVRQGIRELMKFIPYVGSVAGGALAGASTFALGKAACFYYSGVQQGHVPQPDEIRRYYAEQLAVVRKSWSARAARRTPRWKWAYASGRPKEHLMSRWRIIVVALLTLGPFVVLAGIGSYYLWTTTSASSSGG